MVPSTQEIKAKGSVLGQPRIHNKIFKNKEEVWEPRCDIHQWWNTCLVTYWLSVGHPAFKKLKKKNLTGKVSPFPFFIG